MKSVMNSDKNSHIMKQIPTQKTFQCQIKFNKHCDINYCDLLYFKWACSLLSVTLENALCDIVLKDHTKAHIGRVQPNKLHLI